MYRYFLNVHIYLSISFSINDSVSLILSFCCRIMKNIWWECFLFIQSNTHFLAFGISALKLKKYYFELALLCSILIRWCLNYIPPSTHFIEFFFYISPRASVSKIDLGKRYAWPDSRCKWPDSLNLITAFKNK